MMLKKRIKHSEDVREKDKQIEQKTKKKISKSQSEKSGDKLKNLLNTFFDLRHPNGFILFASIIFLLGYIFSDLKCSKKDIYNILEQNTSVVEPEIKQIPTYWYFTKSGYTGHLLHVGAVLNRLGYVQGNNLSDWDLLWAHDYPFTQFYQQLNNLRPHQKVNHFPGTGYITNKIDLSITKHDNIPESFRIPEDIDDFKEFAKNNPNALFVQKHNQHRGVAIKSVDEIDFKNGESFIQKYVDKPYLVDGHKFDIGVYVIITSVDPLRIYIYNGDILFRYCPVKYHPFDSSNLDKYVIADDYLPTWEVPSLSQYFTAFGYGMRDSFNAYVESKGGDPRKIWVQIEESIAEVILLKEEMIVSLTKKFKSSRNFFEMMRIDFLMDEDFRVYLMEANMSPNLSAAKFKPNSLLYEQVLYNMLSLVGIGQQVRKPSLEKRSIDEELMISSEKNIMVNGNICATNNCLDSCALPECSLCRPCLEPDMLKSLHEAFREHVNRLQCKRIFPPTMTGEDLSSEYLKLFSPRNQLMMKWFNARCREDSSWC